MEAPGKHRLPPTGDAVCHHHRFGRGTAAVVHGGVRHLHAGDERHLGLKLEEILQRALRHLGLIGRVGGEELAALDEMVDARRDVVAVGAGAEKGRHGGSPHIAAGEGLEGALDLELAHVGRQRRRRLEQHLLRHVAVEALERGSADRLEHDAAIRFREGEIAHQWSPSQYSA